MFLGFDLDGVIINHMFVKIELAKKFELTLLNESETHADNLYRLLGPAKYAEFKYYLYDDPKTAGSAIIMPGAEHVLRALVKREMPFAVISRRKGNYDIPISLLRKNGF